MYYCRFIYILRANLIFEMKAVQFEQEISVLLKQDRILTVADFVKIWPGTTMPTIYSRIRSLLQSQRLTEVGRGKYLAIHKPEFRIPVTKWMMEVNHYLIETCEGVNHCILQKGENLYVEVAKSDISKVMDRLKEKYPKVVQQKDAKRFPAKLEGFIIVGKIISDAPMRMVDKLPLPCLEKMLIDDICNKELGPMDFQKALEVYPVNRNRLQRYASRRGVAEELSAELSSLNQERIQLFASTQKYLATIPVLRAWVFGSFARGEETPESDLDLLVDYDLNGKLSLLDTLRFKGDLEKIIGRDVDLIENGCLKPFALPSAEKDKYLIYER